MIIRGLFWSRNLFIELKCRTEEELRMLLPVTFCHEKGTNEQHRRGHVGVWLHGNKANVRSCSGSAQLLVTGKQLFIPNEHSFVTCFKQKSADDFLLGEKGTPELREESEWRRKQTRPQQVIPGSHRTFMCQVHVHSWTQCQMIPWCALQCTWIALGEKNDSNLTFDFLSSL